MDLYHSRLTQDDLNDLIIKCKIPRDLHPRLPSEEFVMSELLDDAIGPLGLNKVITFKVLCRSSRLYANKAILNAMVWRHPNAAIDDPRPAAGSFNMADVRRLSAHVVKLRDMTECTGAEVQEEPHLDVRTTLQRLPFYCTPPAAADAVIPKHSLEDLTVGTPSSKIVAKDEASKKSALAQSSGITTRPSLFVGDDDESDDDDDDDACGSSIAPAIEGSNTRDSQGKGVMVDDDVASSVGVSRPRPSSGPAPLFRDVSGDAIYTDFFPFSDGPYYATYPKDGVAGNCEFTREEWDAPYQPNFGVLTKEVFKDHAVCKTIVDQFPTLGEMVRVKSVSDDQLTAKMSALHCMMMSHGGELLARYCRLNQSHHEYVLSTNSRLKGYEEKFASLTGLELQVSTLKKQVSGLNDKLATSNASFAKSNAKGKERKKKIKSITKSLYNLHSEVARLSAALNRATILEAERDEEILRLKVNPMEFYSFLIGLVCLESNISIMEA
ncbi:hypothetical protein Tco_1078640 [Tanacetum coccineum]|uniref:Uncharacterized protein n=1 Tax=Tanacetum coccineum TaxID=301880 RepID=A0ABQ5HQ52_9ASTR